MNIICNISCHCKMSSLNFKHLYRILEYSSHNVLWFQVFKTAFLFCTLHLHVIFVVFFSKWNKRKIILVSDMNKYWTQIFVYIPIRLQLFTWCTISRNPICQLIIEVKLYKSDNWNLKLKLLYQKFSRNIQEIISNSCYE